MVGGVELERPAMAEGPSPTPIVTFLSDYGYADEFVGVCHGVIADRCPRARVIDITHSISPHDVRAGAFVLRAALPYVPAGVHLAVIDPGVGSERRAVALRTAAQERLLVGPDNGLLALAVERLGGAAEAIDLEHTPVRLEPVSETFHGRDLFAPVAAALAAGAPLQALGEPLEPAELSELQLPVAELRDGCLRAHALHRDRFGNLALDASREQLEALGVEPGEPLSVRVGDVVHAARRGSTFADVDPGCLLLYEDSQGMTSLAVNLGSAAELLGVARDDELLLESA